MKVWTIRTAVTPVVSRRGLHYTRPGFVAALYERVTRRDGLPIWKARGEVGKPHLRQDQVRAAIQADPELSARVAGLLFLEGVRHAQIALTFDDLIPNAADACATVIGGEKRALAVISSRSAGKKRRVLCQVHLARKTGNRLWVSELDVGELTPKQYTQVARDLGLETILAMRPTESARITASDIVSGVDSAPKLIERLGALSRG